MSDSLDFSNLKILAVEDNVVCSKVIERFLNKFNADVDLVDSPNDALKMAQAKKYDIALIDLNNPEMPGTLLSHKLSEQFPNLKLIAMTAFVESFTREECLNHGFHDLVLKPITFETLKIQIKKVFEEKNSISEVDLKEIMAYFDNDLDFMEKSFKVMKEKLSGKIQSLENAVNDSDHTSLALHAHSIKNSLLYFGKTEALEAISEIEQAARKSDDINYHYPLNTFKSKLDDIENKVKAIHAEIHKRQSDYPYIKLMDQYKTSS